MGLPAGARARPAKVLQWPVRGLIPVCESLDLLPASYAIPNPLWLWSSSTAAPHRRRTCMGSASTGSRATASSVSRAGSPVNIREPGPISSPPCSGTLPPDSGVLCARHRAPVSFFPQSFLRFRHIARTVRSALSAQTSRASRCPVPGALRS